MFRLSLSDCVRPVTVALAVCVLLSGATAFAGEWKGTMGDRNGIPVVQNPAEPMEGPITMQLEEQWRLGGDSDAEEEFFGVISRVTTDKNGDIYLLDSQLNEVKVFSADGEYLRTIGREGEGPGEFRRPQDMFFLPDGNLGVLQLAPGRIVMLTPEGEPAGEHPLPQAEGGATPILVGGQLMGKNLALMVNENKMGEGKIDITRALTLVNSAGEEIARPFSEVRTMEFANAVIDEKVWSTFDRRWNVAPDGRLFAVTQFQDYEIEVYDSAGKEKMIITRPFENHKRDQAEIDRIRGIFEAFTRQVPNAKIVVSEYDQDISAMYPREDGTLWVLNAEGLRERPEGSLGVFDVLNRDGKFVRQVTLMGQGNPLQDGYFFVGNRLYVVSGFLDAAMAAQGGGSEDTLSDEPEPMAVICYQVGGLEAGMED